MRKIRKFIAWNMNKLNLIIFILLSFGVGFYDTKSMISLFALFILLSMFFKLK